MNFDKIINRHKNTKEFHLKGSIIDKVWLHDGKNILKPLELNLATLFTSIEDVYNGTIENKFHHLELNKLEKRRKVERFKNDSGFSIDYNHPFLIKETDSFGSKVYHLYLHIDEVNFKEVDFYTKSFSLDTWNYVIYSIELSGVICLDGKSYFYPTLYFRDLLEVINTDLGDKIQALRLELLKQNINITPTSLYHLDSIYKLIKR